jgi:uncharacterized repeat protein (TIGR04076 family)
MANFEYDVIAKVISQKGNCDAQHKVGDEFLLRVESTPAGLCSWAFNAMMPAVSALQFWGKIPGEDTTKFQAVCPDANNPVVFELRRIPRKS